MRGTDGAISEYTSSGDSGLVWTPGAAEVVSEDEATGAGTSVDTGASVDTGVGTAAVIAGTSGSSASPQAVSATAISNSPMTKIGRTPRRWTPTSKNLPDCTIRVVDRRRDR